MAINQMSVPGPLRIPMRWAALLLLALAILTTVIVRIRMLDFPLERDEGEHAYAGQLLLEGIAPYQLAYSSQKMPGIYLAYAALMSVFGQTPAGIHLGLLAVHLGTLAVLFLIARRYLDLHGSATATAAYTLMTLSPAYLGLAAHATHFVVLPALLGTWLLIRGEKYRRVSVCIASGVLFGMAFLMKQPGMFFGIFGGLLLGGNCIAAKMKWRTVFARLGVYSLGCVLPFLAVCMWLKIAGVFPRFWFWTVTYALEYVAVLPFSAGIECAKAGFASVFRAAPLLWSMAGLGLASVCATRMASGTRLFFLGFFVFSFVAVCPGFYFRAHYFIVLAPAVAMFVGLTVSRIGTWLEDRGSAQWLRHLPLLLAAAACAQSLYADRAVLFTLTPREACRAVYGVNPFFESLDIARHIEQDTRKDQRIVVIGSEPQIYFYARRHSSTGQIYTYSLMEPHAFARKLQEDMIREIEQNPPEYLVFVSIASSWLARPDSSRVLLDWLDGYISQNMQPEGLVQIIDEKTTDIVWGSEAATAPLRSQFFIYIFKKHHAPAPLSLPPAG